MVGRTPKPKELKVLKGTHRKSRDLPNAMEVEVMNIIPTAPADLPQPAQNTWYSICSQLVALKALSSLDLDTLKAYCFQLWVMDEAMENIKTQGFTTTMTNKGGGSYEVKSPFISIYNEALAHVNRIGQQFGFSPSSRTKISMGQVKEKSKSPYEGF